MAPAILRHTECACYKKRALALLFAVMPAIPASGQGARLVTVVPAEQRQVSATLDLVGSVRPYMRSLLASELSGLVEALPVEEGDRVEAGTPLARLRDTVHRLALAEAQGRLSQLQAQLAELEAGTREEEVERARAAMEEAAAIAQKWERELQRVTNLRRERAASDKEYHDTVADNAAGQQRLAWAKAQYDLAVAGPRQEEIDRARFAVESQRAAVDRLKHDLELTMIRAPFAGYVTRKYTEVGQWLAAGGGVVELIDLDRVLVRVDVPESAIGSARSGEVIVVIDALRKTFRGQIARVIPQADERARTFPVEVVLANETGDLKAGMFARARVPAGPTIESVVVPRDAVVQRPGGDYVVVVRPAPTGEGQMAFPVAVQLGAGAGDWVAVSASDVQPGLPVAVKGHDRIFGPEPVQAVPATGAESGQE